MANVTRTMADSSGFIAQVWAQKALDVLASRIVLAPLVTRDTDLTDPGWRGKTLNVPYPGTFAAQDKAADTAVTVQTPSGGASVSVTLSKHKVVDFVVEDAARAQSSTELLDRYVSGPAIAIADAIEDDLFALYTSYSTVGTSGTDLAASTLRTGVKTLDDAKVPETNRFAVVSTKDRIALLGDSALASYFAFSNPAAIGTGALGDLYGMRTFYSQRVPVVAGSPNSTKNIIGTPDSMVLATRPFADAPVGSGVQSAQITEPRSGISIRMQWQYSLADRGVRVGFDVLYGVAALRPACGLVVLS